MKKTILAFLVILCSLAMLRADILTQPASGTIQVGDSLGYRFSCIDGNHLDIYFGDGTHVLDVPAHADFFTYHQYRNPGNFVFHKHIRAIVTVACSIDEYRTITVLENRTISAAPTVPNPGMAAAFTGNNFRTPNDITWNMGDGTLYAHRTNVISHTYAAAGTYTIRAYDWNGDLNSTPVSLTVTVAAPSRAITHSPSLPYVDQEVFMQAVGFGTGTIDWNFGDGTPAQTYSNAVSHRYQNAGVFTVTALEHGYVNLAPVSHTLTILPENRSLTLSTTELRVNQLFTVTANNFREPLIRWNFGDGTIVSGPSVMTHAYTLPGNYLITARDENGTSKVRIKITARVLGISDQVGLDIAEITLDNGKYYKVVSKNSRNIRAQLRMKMRGTGIVSGYWIVDGQPYEFFNETVYQGEIRTIFTREIPGLPVLDPGMHTVSMQLTRPAGDVVFPTLRYFVLPFENEIVVLGPNDGAVVKEDEVPEFAWESVSGGSYYQIAFANSPLPLLHNDEKLDWLDCPDRFRFTPDALTWKGLERNQWVFWKVRATDSGKSTVGESGIREVKIIVPGAQVGISRISDMDGRDIVMGGSFTASRDDRLLVHGEIVYPGDAEYLVLRIYANDSLIDQLLFRDVKKGERRSFETSVPNAQKESRVIFEVLKSSSPSLVIGYAELALKKE